MVKEPNRCVAGKERASIPDTADGKCALFFAAVLAMEGLAAAAEVVVPCCGWIDRRCGPVESVGFQACVLAVGGAAAAEHGVEARIAASQERLVGGFAFVI